MLRLLDGRAKGLDGLSEVWLMVDGRRTNGLAFSGDSEPDLIGDKLALIFVGDCVGVVARTVAGEALFCRLNGDWRPESKESGDGRSGFACDISSAACTPHRCKLVEHTMRAMCCRDGVASGSDVNKHHRQRPTSDRTAETIALNLISPLSLQGSKLKPRYSVRTSTREAEPKIQKCCLLLLETSNGRRLTTSNQHQFNRHLWERHESDQPCPTLLLELLPY